jgi:hypothetical protein
MRSGSTPEPAIPRACRPHPFGLQHFGLKHSSIHRQNYHRSKQQTGQQAELHIGATAQKMIPVAQVLRDRHHQQKQRGEQDQQTTQRPAPLAPVRCPCPIRQVANGPQVRPHRIAGDTPACSNHKSSVTHSAYRVERSARRMYRPLVSSSHNLQVENLTCILRDSMKRKRNVTCH